MAFAFPCGDACDTLYRWFLLGRNLHYVCAKPLTSASLKAETNKAARSYRQHQGNRAGDVTVNRLPRLEGVKVAEEQNGDSFAFFSQPKPQVV
jgi:hypothetical protein